MGQRLSWILLLASTALAQPGANVTERMQIEIDGHVQTARKINGRWFSSDNRELTRTNVGWLWNISGGNARHLVRFDHHYPVDPTKVNLIDRSMGPGEVKAILGPPNSVFPSDRPEQEQQWDYYGRDGYKLSVKFSNSGGIFTADFEPDAKSMPQDVPHLAFRFNGKTTRESYEESKQQRVSRPVPQSQAEFREQLKAEMAQRRSQRSASQVHSEIVTVPAAAPLPAAPPSRKVTAEEIKAVVIGMSRAELITILGEPASRFAIASGEGNRETLEYQTEAGSVSIVIFKGKVSQLPR
jgi:hypothetical protein